MLDAAGGQRLFGFCQDIGHAAVMGVDPAEYVHTLGGRICMTTTVASTNMSSPFMGVTDWRRLCAALNLRHLPHL